LDHTFAAEPAKRTPIRGFFSFLRLEYGMDPQTTPPEERSEAEWREILSEEEYAILRERGTEPKFSGDLLDVEGEGVFRCAGCDTVLFESDAKFGSGSGWPSFYDVASEGTVETEIDDRHGRRRLEVLCGTCGGHLGHVFEDGPEPTGKRYCINSVALEFDPAETN
jgi:peptide-methionine (R)-S-oxide reductase